MNDRQPAKKPVDHEYFTQFRFPFGLKSNGAGLVAFGTRQASLGKNRYDTTLWLLRADGPIQLTEKGELRGFWWLGEDRLLLARPGSAREKAWQKDGLPFTLLQTLPANGPGEALDLARLPLEVEDAAALPGGRLLLLAGWDPRAHRALEEAGQDCAGAATLLKKESGPIIIDSLPVWENGQGFANGRRKRAYLWRDGRTTPLTDEDTEVESLRLCPDGTHALLVAHSAGGVATAANRLLYCCLDTLTVADISLGDDIRHDEALPLEDGSALVAGSDMAAFGLNQNPAFYRVDLPSGKATPLYTGGQYSGWDSVGTDLSMAAPAKMQAAGGAVYFVSTVDECSRLMRLDLAGGAVAPVSRAGGAVSELALPFAGDAGRGIVALAMRDNAGPELYRMEAGRDGNAAETRLTDFNTAVLDEFKTAEPQPLSCQTAGGEVRGFVLLPGADARKATAKKLPAVLYIHGGPKTAYGGVLFHELQLLAAHGFAVVFCNPRGSDGRGDGFADIRGRLGEDDCEDVLAFLDAALAACPQLDENRLGIVGGSYGGFLTNWIIGQSGRFKAAVSQRGISNWASMGLTSDIGYTFQPDVNGASLWEDAEAVWQQSPLRCAPAVKTPTLFIHSAEDYRCPLPEALQMYTALKLHGTEARLCIFEGENHELSRSGKPQNRVRRLQEVVRWLEEHLMGQ